VKAQTWLALGAGAGLVAAALGLLRTTPRGVALPVDAVATVNGAPVRTAQYERAIGALASDRRAPLGDEERRFVLDRLVDEELLVQRALELGLARSDARARADLVAALVDSVTAGASEREPDPAEVRAFYDENRDWFARPGRLRVRQLTVAGAPQRAEAEARERALEASQQLRGGAAFDEVSRELGDPPVAPLPDDWLPPAKLREYLGPGALAALDALAPGAVSDPLRLSGGYSVLQLVDREPPASPPFEAVADEARAELRRRAGDRALRQYIDALRQRAEIRVAGAPP
jgi:hypothetical protein